MQQPEWQKSGSQHIWMPYTQMKTALPPLPVAGTAGCEILLTDGRRLIDGIASWWTACHGYGHPHIVEAIKTQAETMSHVMFGGLQHEPALRLAERLADFLPGDLSRVFFCDSGSVSVEVALKIAVQYWMNLGRSGKKRFLCFVDSYHGDTVGAMSVCDPEDSMHSRFKGYILEQYPHPLPRTEQELQLLEQFLNEHESQLAGAIIEPLLQAACGMRTHSSQCLAKVAEQVQQRDLLLIADEVATGFGRTGTMFACEQAGIVPDIICLSKALTGGALGMGATVARKYIFDAFFDDDASKALMHGPSFMANPLACAAANASLDLFENEPRLQQVRAIEEICRSRLAKLQEHPLVTEVRTLGAMAAIQCKQDLDKSAGMQIAIENGVWLRPLRDVVYLMPPLTISDQQLQQVCDVMVSIVESQP